MRVDQSEGQTGSDQAQTRNALNDDFHYSGNTGNMIFLVGDLGGKLNWFEN